MTDFGKMFEALTGYEPLRWQCRLYEEWLAGEIKPVIDLPTGMGKTNVMAIWFIVRSQRTQDDPLRLPTRLVYVVDRRTVVDQATTLANNIMDSAAKAGLAAPTISTLRGQFADNRDWVRDPSKPAIIIGTVDMIGSRLLFSGYRSSYRKRPLDAGLLGQDSLLILDEAHLSRPFEKLLVAICEFQKRRDGQLCGSPMKVVCMSATAAKVEDVAFRLEGDVDAHTDDFSDETIRQRYNAAKRLQIHPPGEKGKFNSEMAKKAIDMAKNSSRVVVFVRSPEDATKIANEIKKCLENSAVLTGTMRGLERDELLMPPVNNPQHERKTMQRFLHPENKPDDGPAILISTSAGEVGFDLNADHMVCDAAPLDSMIQRLGRVNRRGNGAAEVHLFPGKPKDGKKKSTAENEQESAPAHTYDTASTKTLEILKQLPKLPSGSLDASPKAFADLAKPDDALTPKPKIVEVTDILLDAWSMTTIAEPMPGRPPVADWLRGISVDLPETTIAWRAELDVPGFGDLNIDDIEEWFDAHRVLPHETLTVPSYKASEWMLKRWKSVDKKAPPDIAARPCVIDQGGLRIIEIQELMQRLEKKQVRDILNADIILPASFGGIERGRGLLDSAAPKQDPGFSNEILAKAAKAPDVADEQLPETDRRYRQIKVGESVEALCGEKPKDSDDYSEFVLELPSSDDSVRQLISMVPKRLRLEYGTRQQSLAEHVAAVEDHAKAIAVRLNLSKEMREALELAATWHDKGKNRIIWQRAVGGSMEDPLAKSGGRMRFIAGNYRHEFGSLREFSDGHGENLDPEIFDLAAHLIATHHGRARPHFPKGGFDPKARAKSPEIATEAMRRFARLQRKYGHWRLAWLENLLRCADALASAENDGGKNK